MRKLILTIGFLLLATALKATQIDVALCIDKLVPSAVYYGGVTDNTEAQYNAIRWQDSRSKPNWNQLQAAQILLNDDQAKIVADKVIEAKIQAENRRVAIVSLKSRREIPADYIDVIR